MNYEHYQATNNTSDMARTTQAVTQPASVDNNTIHALESMFSKLEVTFEIKFNRLESRLLNNIGYMTNAFDLMQQSFASFASIYNPSNSIPFQNIETRKKLVGGWHSQTKAHLTTSAQEQSCSRTAMP
ncbi:hypothetical protein DASC09_048410 [Saccharomycopsis crataegensis]|uniref:DASH complex subunit DAM1 n=1 Tax=Saccharomycopsis crataegensis TaxID=43959 RepID=A0AAV5QSG2_9ASCO|nr:hypothetical protein DASC09_048410 [Saccharomycopsis crataegensis]